MASRAGSRVFRAAHRRAAAASVAALASALLVTPAAHAQGAGNGFLFGTPNASVSLRVGYSHATAGGDLFSFVTDTLTASRSDFSGPTIAADVALRLAPQLDLVLGAGYSGRTASSEYRNLVDQNNLPIEQNTTFQRVPVTASIRAYLTPTGRSVGSFAWVPARFAPYVGVGGGAMWYRFRQQGDFVDYQTNNVYNSDLTSSSWTPEAQGMLGFDYSLSPRLALNGEAKYLWAKGTLDQTSFSGFDRIDLSGVDATLGLSIRF